MSYRVPRGHLELSWGRFCKVIAWLPGITILTRQRDIIVSKEDLRVGLSCHANPGLSPLDLHVLDLKSPALSLGARTALAVSRRGEILPPEDVPDWIKFPAVYAENALIIPIDNGEIIRAFALS